MNEEEGTGGAERRKFRRTDVMLKVRYAAARDFLVDYTENVSSGGLFIATEEPFSEGDIIDFEISFPGLLSPIPLSGRVTWRRPAGGGEPVGIGVEVIGEPGDHRPLSVLVTRLQQQDEPQDTPPLQRPLPPVAEGESFRVLLVEDNVVVRDMFRYGIQKLLRSRDNSMDFVVCEAENGSDAWKLLEQESFNLIVLDLYMPVMDGKQLIKRVRETPATKDIPIIVVSSGGDEDRRRALQAGADLFLAKPIKLRQLVETIGRLLGNDF